MSSCIFVQFGHSRKSLFVYSILSQGFPLVSKPPCAAGCVPGIPAASGPVLQKRCSGSGRRFLPPAIMQQRMLKGKQQEDLCSQCIAPLPFGGLFLIFITGQRCQLARRICSWHFHIPEQFWQRAQIHQSQPCPSACRASPDLTAVATSS